MYHPSSATPNDPLEPDAERLRTLLDNLSNLKGKLQNFTVIDEFDQPIGEIRDLILDSGHQLNLVISQLDSQGQPTVLLNGRRIKKVSVQTQSVFVDITQADLRFLPEYFPSQETIQPPAAAFGEISADNPDWTQTLQNSDLEGLPVAPLANSDFGAGDLEVLDFGTSDFDTELSSTADNFALNDSNLGQPDNDLMDWGQETENSFSLESLSLDSSGLDSSGLDPSGFDISGLGSSSLNPSGFDIFEDELDLSESLNLTTNNDMDWGNLTELPQPNEAASPMEDFALSRSDEAELSLGTQEASLELSQELMDFDFGTEGDSLTASSGDEFSASLSELSLSELSDLEPANELEAFPTQSSSLENFTWENLESSDRPDQLTSFDLSSEDAFADELANLELVSEPAENLATFDLGAIAASESPSLSLETDPLSLEDLSDLNLELTESQFDPQPSFETDFPNTEPVSFSETLLNGLSENQPALNLENLGAQLPELSFDTANPEETVTNPVFQEQEEPNFDSLDLSFASDFSLSEDSNGSDEIAFENEISFENELALGDEISFEDELAFGEESTANPSFLTDGTTTEEFNSLSGWELEPVAFEPQVLPEDFTANAAPPNLTAPIPAAIASLSDLNFALPEEPETTANFSLDALEMPSQTADLTPVDLTPVQSFDFGLPSKEESLLALSNLDLDLSETVASPGEILPVVDSLPEMNESQPSFSPELGLGMAAGAAAVTGFITSREESSPTSTSNLVNQPIEQPIAPMVNSTEAISTVTSPETIDQIVPLLEERLRVEYQRRKVGEIIVRKKIETRMIQVPVRYEKLVIEQVGSEQKLLAEVDLSQGVLDNVQLPGMEGPAIVSGEFKSPNTASYVLDAIAKTLQHRCKNIRIEIELDDSKLQKAYQEWLDQCSQI